MARTGLRWLSIISLALAGTQLAACSSLNPFDWYRDASGLSKNDATPDQPNTKNLEAGSQRDYPNLASVPPAPTTALSTAEREALTQHLISDRANAKYIDEQLRVGPAASAAPPAPAPVRAALEPAMAPPPAAAPGAASNAPAAENAPPAASASAPSSTPASSSSPPAAHDDAAEARPQESPLTSPEIHNLPQPETPRPAPPPPPPDLVSGTQSSPVPAAPARAADQTAAAPAPASAVQPVAPPAAEPALSPVAQITFAENSAKLSAADQRILGEVVPLQRRSGGAVRVVGHAAKGRGEGAAQQLASFRMALDRANAVAAALRQAGIAPNRILVEAAPPTDETGAATQRTEIFLEN